MPWINGLDMDFLLRWRKIMNRNTMPEVRSAAHAVARELRAMTGRLPVQQTIDELSRAYKTESVEVTAYLAAIGLGCLMAFRDTEEWNGS